MPGGGGAGGSVYCGNEGAVEFADERGEVFDDLLPLCRVADGVLAVDAGRDRKPEAYAESRPVY